MILCRNIPNQLNLVMQSPIIHRIYVDKQYYRFQNVVSQMEPVKEIGLVAVMEVVL